MLNEAHDVVPYAQSFSNRLRVPDEDNPQAYLIPTTPQDVVNKKYIDGAIKKAKEEVKKEVEKEIGDDKFVFAKLSEKDNGVVDFRQHFTNRITVPDIATPIPGVVSVTPEDVVNKRYIDGAVMKAKEDVKVVVEKDVGDKYLRKTGGDFYSWDFYPIPQDAERKEGSDEPADGFYEKYLKWGRQNYDKGGMLYTKDIDVDTETLFYIAHGAKKFEHLKGQCVNLGTVLKYIQFSHTEREGYTCKPKFSFSFDPIIPITGVDIPGPGDTEVPFLARNWVLRGHRSDYNTPPALVSMRRIQIHR